MTEPTTDELARELAHERRLDWLLDEAIGGERARATPAGQPAAPRSASSRWLAAALIALGLGAVLGVMHLRSEARQAASAPQDPQPPTPDAKPVEWTECHGPAALDQMPAGVVALRGFNFDDDALAKLASDPRFARLQQLDLGAMDPDARGYGTAIPLTDAGVTELGKLTELRWLSLSQCFQVTGATFAALEALPNLEHLDLTFTHVTSKGLEQLANLPRLRHLDLSYCRDFHGRSLAEIAKIAGLQWLALRDCSTVAAKDALQLTRLRALRHLDLRDCQGHFRGQTMSMGGELESPPIQDGIGVTDAVVAALTDLPLETLLLGGCEALTDAIAEPLAKLTTLRTLDLGELPKVTAGVLPRLPTGLHSLALDDNPQFDDAALARLPAALHLRSLGLGGLVGLTDAGLATILARHALQELDLHVPRIRTKDGTPTTRMTLSPASLDAILAQRGLRSLNLHGVTWVDGSVLAKLAELPEIAHLDLSRCRKLKPADLAAFPHLQDLNVYSTGMANPDVVAVVARWPGCLVVLPNGNRHQVP